MITLGLDRPVYSYGLRAPGAIFVHGDVRCLLEAEDDRVVEPIALIPFVADDDRTREPLNLDRILDAGRDFRIMKAYDPRTISMLPDQRVFEASDTRVFTASANRTFTATDDRTFLAEHQCEVDDDV